MRAKTVEGIVVKVTQNSIVLLCENGTFTNVPLNLADQVPMLGQHFCYAEKQQLNLNLTKYLAIASIFILTILAYTFMPMENKDSAYIIAMDINPSIEITLNKNLAVQEISGLNSDGKYLIESMEVSNHHLFDVTEKIIMAAKEKGYFQSQEEALVSITVISLDKVLKPLELDIEEELNQSFNDNNIVSGLVVSLGSKELYQEAKELNLSVNKLVLYKELYAQGKVQSLQEVRGKTVLQLREMRKIIVPQKKDEDNLHPNSEQRLRDVPSMQDQAKDLTREIVEREVSGPATEEKEQNSERKTNRDGLSDTYEEKKEEQVSGQDGLNDPEEEEKEEPASRQDSDYGEDEDLSNDMESEGTSPPYLKRIR